VVARALASRRRGAWLGAAAVLAFLVGGGGAFWAYRTIGALTAERDRLAAQVEALHDTVATFIHGPATRLIQIPVSTGGRVGAVTIFADSLRHRWPCPYLLARSCTVLSTTILSRRVPAGSEIATVCPTLPPSSALPRGEAIETDISSPSSSPSTNSPSVSA